jgi:hypothetical protein
MPTRTLSASYEEVEDKCVGECVRCGPAGAKNEGSLYKKSSSIIFLEFLTLVFKVVFWGRKKNVKVAHLRFLRV